MSRPKYRCQIFLHSTPQSKMHKEGEFPHYFRTTWSSGKYERNILHFLNKTKQIAKFGFGIRTLGKEIVR
ncbi:unnamed protein product [Haemonchus placei]|uniref:Uncharacterized protein n=1 Tax=Haemonchus placei TaxID=6290 RepID=A0A3P7UMB9_HAEPC|nr:unnamed protein product [Haemonchus placei]